MSTALKSAPSPAPVPTPQRMSLDKLVTGKLVRPRKLVLYGPEGFGKTTFAAGAPTPIFVAAEDGTDALDVVRFPRIETWSDVLEAVRTLTNENHQFKTVVFDTLDAIEPLLWSHMINRDSSPKRKLTDVESYGYGKGYNKAVDDWRVFLASLERLRAAKGMNIIFLAHSWVKAFKNPRGEDFDRYEMKLHAKASAVIKEWCDEVLFGNYEAYAHHDNDNRERVRGVSTGARLIFTEWMAAYDAKNRSGLPASLPLSWADFEAAVTAGRAGDPAQLRAEIERKAKDLGGEVETATEKLLKDFGNDTQNLTVLNNRLNAKLAERES